MARKGKHPEHENLERWLVSYADFITLLFATFTALYALAQSDIAKLKDVSQAIREGFEEQSILHGIKSIMQGKSPPTKNPDPISSEKGAGSGILGKFESMTYRPGEIKSLQEFSKGLSQDVQEINVAIQAINERNAMFAGAKAPGIEDKTTPLRSVEASVQERGIRVSFDSRVLFAPGSAALQPQGRKFLDTVAERLKKYTQSTIQVEGHTDNLPIATVVFPSNWELSAARASSIVRYLIGKHQYNPSTLVAAGYGDTQPLATNSTAEGRSKNRRVDIVLLNQHSQNLSSPRLQYLKETSLLPPAPVPEKPAPHPAVSTPDSVHPPAKPAPAKPMPIPIREGPVKVIIKEKDGTERVLAPKTTTAKPQSQKH